jgi:integrase
MFHGDANTLFHVFHHSATATLANDLVMSRVFVANRLGHARLSNTAHYAHSKPDALVDIAGRA